MSSKHMNSHFSGQLDLGHLFDASAAQGLIESLSLVARPPHMTPIRHVQRSDLRVSMTMKQPVPHRSPGRLRGFLSAWQAWS